MSRPPAAECGGRGRTRSAWLDRSTRWPTRSSGGRVRFRYCVCRFPMSPAVTARDRRRATTRSCACRCASPARRVRCWPRSTPPSLWWLPGSASSRWSTTASGTSTRASGMATTRRCLSTVSPSHPRPVAGWVSPSGGGSHRISLPIVPSRNASAAPTRYGRCTRRASGRRRRPGCGARPSPRTSRCRCRWC